jgi:hypothetical protein
MPGRGVTVFVNLSDLTPTFLEAVAIGNDRAQPDGYYLAVS